MKQFNKTQGNDVADDTEDKRIRHLAQKYEDKPYHIRWKVLYSISKSSSFLFNIGSALGAFALCYYVTYLLTKEHVSACLLAAVAVALWEVLKRYTIGEMYKDYFADNRLDPKLVTFVILLVGGSISATYFGVKSAIPDLMGGPQLESYQDKTIALRNIIAEQKKGLEDFNKDKSNYNAQGEMYYDLARKTRPQMVQKISDLEIKLAAAEEKTNTTNENKSIAHTVYVTANASQYALAAALFDVLLLLCFFFSENYDYKEAYFRGVTHTQLAKRNASDNRPQKSIPVTVPIRKDGTERIKTERNGTATHGTDKDGTERLQPHKQRAQTDRRSDDNRSRPYSLPVANRTNRVCLECGTNIANMRSDAKYCDAKCRKAGNKKQ